jgi:hypothetical protein
MGITLGRRARLGGLAAAVATVAALAVTGATAGPALADATDGTGTATITFSTSFLAHLAKYGIIAIPEYPAASSDTGGADAYTYPVTGGTGTDTNYTGIVNLGGALTLLDATTGKTIELTSLALDYFNGDVTGVPTGSTTPINLFTLAGDFSTNNVAGTPPAPSTETFSASQLDVASWGAAYLNNHLGSWHKTASGKKYYAFNAGVTTIGTGAFTITYTVAFS